MRTLLSNPVVRAALTSGCVMTLGDVACQRLQRRGPHSSLEHTDWARTLRFGAVGLTLHGPFFLKAFQWLDRAMPPPAVPCVKAAIKKSVYGQVTIFPVYVTLFYLYMGALEGKSPGQCVQKLRDAFGPTLATGSLFWPTANLFNFMMVPPSGRVAYVAGAGLLWNSFLSWANVRYGQLGSSSSSGGVAEA